MSESAGERRARLSSETPAGLLDLQSRKHRVRGASDHVTTSRHLIQSVRLVAYAEVEEVVGAYVLSND